MSTPSNFFSSDEEPGDEQQPGDDGGRTTPVPQEGQRHAAPDPAASGPLHRPASGSPTPTWGTAPAPTGPAGPQPAGPSSPQQAGSAPQVASPWPAVSSPQPPPQPPAGPQHAGPPRPPQPPFPPSPGQPAPGPQDSGRVPTQGGAPQPPWRGRRQEQPDERTSIISAEELAQARDQAIRDGGAGDFFTDSPDPERSAQQGWPPPPLTGQTSGPQPPLFGGPMGGGEPFTGASSYSGAAEEPEDVIASHRRPAATGWRKAVSKMTFGLINPGPSAKQLHAEELIRRIRASLVDVYVVAFVNSKGGVGKTTMAVAAGNAIARERGDRVIVVDVDTDLGNLSSRFHESGGPKANIEALASLPSAGSYSNVRVFTVQNDDRLEMLSSQNDPRSSYRLNSQDFDSAMQILGTHYNVIILDCGTSITSPLFPAIAKHVNCLVVVASQDPPGLNGAWRTLTWLQAHGWSRLLPRTVVALNRTASQKPKVDMKDVSAKFREQISEVVEIPFDDHLDEGGAVDFATMHKKTQKAVMELAGSIAQYYPARQPQQRPEDMGRY